MAVIHVANLDTLAGRGTWPLKVQDKAEPEISAWCSSTVVRPAEEPVVKKDCRCVFLLACLLSELRHVLVAGGLASTQQYRPQHCLYGGSVVPENGSLRLHKSRRSEAVQQRKTTTQKHGRADSDSRISGACVGASCI